MRFRLAALAAVAVLAGSACGSPAAAPVAEVEYAGCRFVFEPGPVCVLRSKRELRLWVRARPEHRVEVRLDGKPADAKAVAVGEGRRLTMTVPLGTNEVAVRVETPAGPAAIWSLALEDPPADATAAAGPSPTTAPQWVAPPAASSPAPQQSSRREIVEEVYDKTGRAYKQLRSRDLAAARATLAELRLPEDAPAESRYLAIYHRGLLAEREGDFRTALAEVQRSVEISQRVGPDRYLWLAEEELALLLRAVGRSREAAQLFERLRRTPYAGDVCEEAELLHNQAWSALLAREAGEPIADPTGLLQEALAKYDGCDRASAEAKVNIAINLALAHLQEARPRQAAELLRRARVLEPHPPLPHTLWWLDLEGRIALAEGRPAEARDHFAALAELAAAASAFDAQLRAAFGQARALRALGDDGAALAVLQGAESLLDAQSLQVPLQEGRETFLAARRSIVGLHLELLLEIGRAREALDVARHARARLLRQLAQVDSLQSLPAEGRAKRAQLLTEYQQRRAALEERARDDWKLPADEVRGERAARKAEAAAVQALLDRAYLLLGNVGERTAGSLPPAGPGELVLAYHPLSGRSWVGFADDGVTVAVHRFELPADRLPAAEQLAARLLLPFRAQIEKAARLRVLTTGALEGVDVHALPLDGDALLALRPVAYGLDLPLVSSSPSTREATALVVADPRGDLPGARAEARAVRAALGAGSRPWRTELLGEADADASAVRTKLAAVDLLHYAGHGAYSGLAGWDSSLLLADDTRLVLGDLLALQRVPRWVVLSGCDTGRSSDELPVAGLGLAQAFLLAGSQAVVASTQETEDRSVPAFFAELYRQWDRDSDLAAAMQRAQLDWRRRDPQAAWSSFRLFVR